MEIKRIKISKLKINPDNPRIIKDDKFDALVESIKNFPEMLDIRPIVCNSDMMILGGDKRFKASKEAGLKEVPCIIADQLTEDQQKEFIIRDNVSSGDWDYKILSDQWDEDLLKQMGVDIFHNLDFSGKNNEIDAALFGSELTLKLKFNEKDYKYVTEQFSEIAASPEEAIIQLLKDRNG